MRILVHPKALQFVSFFGEIAVRRIAWISPNRWSLRRREAAHPWPPTTHRRITLTRIGAFGEAAAGLCFGAHDRHPGWRFEWISTRKGLDRAPSQIAGREPHLGLAA